MKILIMKLLLFFFIIVVIKNANGQISLPNEIQILKVQSEIDVDGNLSEQEWQKAIHISNFTQRELDEGKPASEKTEVAVLYDEKNLYIGIWCYDKKPDQIIARKMQRDFSWRGEDNFEIIIDSYHNQRDGYLFVTNPNGARADVLIQDNGRSFNKDWDGVWDVKASITNQGWFAEFRIPFSTIRFSSAEEQVWGINFERNIRRKHEQVMWQGWSRDSEIEQLSRAGKLVGLCGLNNVKLVEFKPYGISGVELLREEKNSGIGHIGGDLNYLITPTMRFNLTVNTDFAQVESDRAQVNLTRFSLFFPEKREFFLEGRNYFDFSLGRRIQPFYTRRIGLSSDDSKIPIIAGVRLLGKTGNATLGGMSIQTAKKDSMPSTNYSIFRWKQDIWQQSSIGIIGVGKMEPNRQNGVYGGDFLYSTSKFMKNKNLNIGAALAQSYTSDADIKTGGSHRFVVNYPNDFIEFDAVWQRTGKNFNPETGYVRRENSQMYYAELQFNPRPTFIPWIRKLAFKPMDFNYYINDETGEMQSLSTEFRPLGFSTKSGEFFEFNIQRSAENIMDSSGFEIHDNIVITPGEYWFTHYEIQFNTFSGRPLFGFFEVNWGDFYNGNRTVLAGHVIWRINKCLSVSSDYERNIINLPAGNFSVNEAGGRVEFALNPDLFGSVFGQWNDEDEEVLLNFRVNWIPKPGTNFYFVVNQSFDTHNNSWKLMDTTILTKFVWRFVM